MYTKIQPKDSGWRPGLKLIETYTLIGQNRFREAIAVLNTLPPKLEVVVSAYKVCRLGIQAQQSLMVELPSLVQETFNRFNSLAGTPLLVGSTIHLLLKNQPLNDKQDIDIVFITPKRNTLVVPGFTVCPYNPYLYTANSDAASIDCYLAPSQYNFLSRDFTISCLYCDSKGYISDPSGFGISDFQNNILRTVNDPVECFQEDPIRLLRAIKWMVLGYEPIPELEKAMHDWQPIKPIYTPHLEALAKKQLSCFNETQQREYYSLITYYGLHEKLFGIAKKEKPNPLTFFKLFYTNIHKGITSCSIEKAYLLNTTNEDINAYIKKNLKYMPEIEALDLNTGRLGFGPEV